MSETTHASVELPAERSGGTRGSKPNKKRAPVRIDKRYVLGRRATKLASIYRERLGLTADDADPVLLDAVERAARLTALAEDASARAVRGDPQITLDDVVRLQRVSDLAVRRLHLDKHRKSETVGLSDYLAQREHP